MHHNEHAILHIAGGGASKNVPAGRLYARFGFVAIPRHDEGGPFVKPDRDLFVLGNIGRALGALPWEEVLQIGSEGDKDESDVAKKRLQKASRRDATVDELQKGDGLKQFDDR